MNPQWLTVTLVRMIELVFCFLASPSGGREIGRAIFDRIGLWGGAGKRK